MDKLEINIAGEEVELHAERALFWPRERALFIADLHFGKSNTFQKFGVPLLDNTVSELERLSALLKTTNPNRVVFLGDLLHSPVGTTNELADELVNWMNKQQVEFILVKGNHDRVLKRRFAPEVLRIIDGDLSIGPFACCHQPIEHPNQHVLCGHLHPGFKLNERGGNSLHAACFWIQPKLTVLPAFGAFTGTKNISPTDGDRVVLVGDGQLKQII